MNTARLRSYQAGVIATAGATAMLTSTLAPMQDRIGLLNEGLLFLLLTLAISAVWGWPVGLFAAVLSNLALNFFFVPPLYEFTVQSFSNVVALVVFLIVSAIGGSLLSNARAAASAARRSANETRVLLGLSRAMVGQMDPSDALAALCHEVVQALAAPGAAVLSGSGTQWRVHAAAGSSHAERAPDSNERVMADQALRSGTVTRLGHTGLGAARRPRVVRPAGTRRLDEMASGSSFVPLRIGERTLGVLRVDGPIGDTPFREHPDRILAAFASEAAQGVQRAELAQAAAYGEALIRADEMKTALMTSISHDLKTPLAGIKASVSSLLGSSVNWSQEDTQAFLETIDSQADRLNRVISDILDLNRIEAGVIAPNLQPVETRVVLDETRARTSLVTSGREVTVDAPPGAIALADESLLLQALVNLVENAAKYSIPGGNIHLRGHRRGDQIWLSVEDDGPGIAAADVPHVFERFYRAAEQSRRVKGSGLGLAIVKGFVTLSGGSIRVESSTSGTRFIVALPVAASAVRTA